VRCTLCVHRVCSATATVTTSARDGRVATIWAIAVSQLCFAEELTDCTLEETLCVDVDCEEGVCEVDDSCDGEYCTVYGGSDYSGSGAPFAFTDQYCEQRGLGSNESRYHCRFQNEFMAPSPTAEMGCNDLWIDDGAVCDDSCRADECSFDGDDCAEGTLCLPDSFCFSHSWLYRTHFPSLSGESISTLCGEIVPGWPDLVELMAQKEQECTELFPRFDFNDDDHINFRESIPLVAFIAGNHRLSWEDKWYRKYNQINCSECVGMEIYDFYHEKCSADSGENPMVAPSPTAGVGCLDWWIGDGHCDDECRVAGCAEDEGDCVEGTLCATDFCTAYWSQYLDGFAVPSVAGANVSYLCAERVGGDAELLHLISTRTKQECDALFPRFDFNDDDHINFREFIPLMNFLNGDYALSWEDDWYHKYNQINCSDCVGVGIYDYYHG